MNIRLENPLDRLIEILRRTPTAIFGRIAHKLWVLQILRNRMQGVLKIVLNGLSGDFTWGRVLR